MARPMKEILSVLLIVTHILATKSGADPLSRKIDGVHLNSGKELQTELSRSSPLNLNLLEIENIHINDDSGLPHGIFKGSSIRQLILRNITLKELSSPGIKESLFDGLQDSLESIAFVGTQIKENTTSHLDMFSGFKKLKTIIMTRSSTNLFLFTGEFRGMKDVPLTRIMATVSNFGKVPANSLENFCDTLEELILEGCLISIADKNWFNKATMKALRRLNLSSNGMSTLNRGFFNRMPGLKELDLQDNYLFSVADMRYTEMFNNVDLTYLGLYDTMLTCEENIDWLIKVMGEKPLVYEKPYRELQCRNGTAVKNLKIQHSLMLRAPSYGNVDFGTSYNC